VITPGRDRTPGNSWAFGRRIVFFRPRQSPAAGCPRASESVRDFGMLSTTIAAFRRCACVVRCCGRITISSKASRSMLVDEHAVRALGRGEYSGCETCFKATPSKASALFCRDSWRIHRRQLNYGYLCRLIVVASAVMSKLRAAVAIENGACLR
jgi:hypothetical protein